MAVKHSTNHKKSTDIISMIVEALVPEICAIFYCLVMKMCHLPLTSGS